MTRALFIGAHPDDIELGCGGTIYKHRDEWDVHCLVMTDKTLSGDPLGIYQKKSFQALDVNNYSLISGFSPSMFHQERNDIWKTIRDCRVERKFDIVFTHTPDEHQDHVTVYQETMRNFQGSTILSYPIPRSQTSWSPNYWETLDESALQAKIAAVGCYDPYLFQGNYEPGTRMFIDPDWIRCQCRHDGGYIGAKYAESFQIQRAIDLC